MDRFLHAYLHTKLHWTQMCIRMQITPVWTRTIWLYKCKCWSEPLGRGKFSLQVPCSHAGDGNLSSMGSIQVLPCMYSTGQGFDPDDAIHISSHFTAFLNTYQSGESNQYKNATGRCTISHLHIEMPGGFVPNQIRTGQGMLAASHKKRHVFKFTANKCALTSPRRMPFSNAQGSDDGRSYQKEVAVSTYKLFSQLCY